MNPRLNNQQLAQLRKRCAEIIAKNKSCNVPAICKRLGLEDGTEEEAFRSKITYSHKRLMAVEAKKIIEIAEALSIEHDEYELSEALAKILEQNEPSLTELTRKRLISVFDDGLCAEMPEVDLLCRVWPLDAMPARYQDSKSDYTRTLKDDVIQHTINNYDWDNRELLEAVGFLHCSNRTIFKFLETVTSPLLQTVERQNLLVLKINSFLEHDGYILSVAKRISGSPVYCVKRKTVAAPVEAIVDAALLEFDQGTVHERWRTAIERQESDPRSAITSARTLLEDVCKWILVEDGKGYSEKDDLPVLYRNLSKILNLAPDEHTEQLFKQILGSCQSVVESVGALRNKLGDAHSQGPKRAKPLPRHAELAVNLAGSMSIFLVATWEARKISKLTSGASNKEKGAHLSG
jgi:AbiJ N-terminal domain 3/Abortive infection C-terminus